MTAKPTDIRDQLRDAIGHFEHVLPGQAPIKDFVHHNTLHGYEHLRFDEALAQARRITGAAGYLPAEEFRKFYQRGRITREDLEQVLNQSEELDAGNELFQSHHGPVYKRDLYLNALTVPLSSITACQLVWQMEEMNAFGSFQEDVAEASRQQVLSSAMTAGIRHESAAVEDLWQACLEALDLEHYVVHPEELMDLSPEDVETMFSALSSETQMDSTNVQRLIQKESANRLKNLLDDMGQGLTLRCLLETLTGQDLMEEIAPIMVRRIAGFLDQGVAAWQTPGREKGFYAAWREGAKLDPAWIIDSIPEWQDHIDALPEDPLETIVTELRRLDLPEERWAHYLELKALELPGWSGMFLWRHLHPGYEDQDFPIDMMDYLAFRIVLERLIAQRLCRDLWQIEPSLKMLRWYFRHNPAELVVRHALFNTRLPEYLSSLAQRLVNNHRSAVSEQSWQQVAQLIWTWRQSPSADKPQGYSVYRSGWRLFRLTQHLGLSGADVRQLQPEQVASIFDCMDLLDQDKAGFIWLQAYERNYREELFNAIANNTGRGRWAARDEDISAQLIFCMDDREEGLRRHLEEINPTVETLGAAAHFGVPHLWRGLDDRKLTPLCPVVVTPTHVIRERAQDDCQELKLAHDKRRRWRIGLGNILHQEIRRNLFSSALLIALAAPGALLTLAGKVLAPLKFSQWGDRLRRKYDMEVPTELAFKAEDDTHEPTPETPRLGFTEAEQLVRVETFLQNIGLTGGFSPLVVIVAHGSSSQNNPHLAAYDCGACSGRHSGPNARIVAAIANDPEIRIKLAERGIAIPQQTWFVAAEHNTCTEDIEWYDLDVVPVAFQTDLEELRFTLDEACNRHAHERCRKLASAPRTPNLKQARDHIRGRSYDFSQARPELGHATNAAAIIGRRSVSRGAFFDRRVFLISYDPTTDPEGKVLERLLLANAPVGAGINLEYYFSTVDNENYGCGSKITHNMTGLFGVMEGTSSDLRTGLPRQMIEIHEAMRLQVLVEASTEILTEIYMRQPPLQELVGNGWLLLSAVDPEIGEIFIFDPASGWLPWQGEVRPLPEKEYSADWYKEQYDHLAPALISKKRGEAYV